MALLLAGAVQATPGLPLPLGDKSETQAAAAPAETPEQTRVRLQAQLDQARSERQKLEDDALRGALPVGISEDDAAKLRRALDEIIFALEGQLRLAGDLAAARKARAEAEAAEAAWHGFAEPPPFSALMVDGLRDEAGTVRARISALEAGGAQSLREVANLQKRAEAAEAEVRRLLEAKERAKTDADAAAAAWRYTAAQRAARATATLAALSQMAGEAAALRAAAERARLKLLQRQIEIAARDERFSDADLARLRSEARAQSDKLQKQLDEAIVRSNRRTAERQRAAQALAATSAKEGTSEHTALQDAVRAADAWVETARFEVDALSGLLTVAGAREDLARLRFEAGRSDDPAERRRALDDLADVQSKVAQWRVYADNQRELARLAESREAQRLLRDSGSTPASGAERELLAALQARVAMADQLVRAAEQAQRSLQRWVKELDANRTDAGFAHQAADAAARFMAGARALWNFELFATEDTTVVDGQRITTTRGVTIGKSVGALFIFLLGMMLAGVASRRLERLLVKRGLMSAPQGRTVRRWILALTAAVLVVLVLNLARIPLTVFAFLGGALAIGVGFGTQTLIRNFISGLILLVERQVRVGDVIEVDGTTGTVTEVNLRSSTVRSADGVEALLPNATLLEQKVVNWTHTDPRVRRVVRIGVAYGSPARTVAELLKECAERHGLVLKEPAPVVLLEDFGADALVFALQFWIEMSPDLSSQVVMSDLRFMIDKRFAEAGIVIAYPQRDVHLSAAQPLEVRVLPAAPPRSAEQGAAAP
jgi:potassium efflux system protein